MPSRAVKLALYVIPTLIVVVLVVWMEVSPNTLAPLTYEDGWIENLTAIGFGIGAVAFGLAAWRTPYLRKSATAWALAMTIGWALISFVCMGEEISWGQRIFGIQTPAYMARINKQDEFNIHDIGAVDNFMGGTYRWLSIYMVLGGLGIPLLAKTKIGKTIFKKTYFPVLPWCYTALWLGAYFYGKYYRVWEPIPGLHPRNAATEIREMMIGLGSGFFAVHTLLWPSEVYIGYTE
jgi:hypothetical protein